MAKKRQVQGVSGDPSKRALGRPKSRLQRFLEKAWVQLLILGLVTAPLAAALLFLVLHLLEPKGDHEWTTAVLLTLMGTTLILLAVTYLVEYLLRGGITGPRQRSEKRLVLRRVVMVGIVVAMAVSLLAFGSTAGGGSSDGEDSGGNSSNSGTP